MTVPAPCLPLSPGRNPVLDLNPVLESDAKKLKELQLEDIPNGVYTRETHQRLFEKILELCKNPMGVVRITIFNGIEHGTGRTRKGFSFGYSDTFRPP